MRFGHSDAHLEAIMVTPQWQQFSYTGMLPRTKTAF